MKKIHLLFAVWVALSLPLSALGATETVDGITWTYTVSGGKASVGSGSQNGDRAVPTSTTGAIDIPVTLGGYSVTSIDSYAFYGCSGLTSVTIPVTVRSIGDFAFGRCSSLTRVTIPYSVMSIGFAAFSDCSGLTSVTIPDSVTSIGELAFYCCSGLTSVIIGESVTNIGVSAFEDCSRLTSLTIGKSVTSIGSSAFRDCRGLTSVTIPNSVTNIEGYAFSGCSGLTSVTMGESVTSIGQCAFDYCHGVKEIVFLGGVPAGLSNSFLPLGSGTYVRFVEAYGAEWTRILLPQHGTVMNYLREPSSQVDILSARMRATDPTIMDVVYKVTSTNDTVNVRALAFEDGVRSFSKVVRPETFVEGTGANLGDGVAANVEHTVSWRVSADWATDLAKVSFEILVSDAGQLPMELVTISAVGSNAEMTINVRRPRVDDLFNALLWHYANCAGELTVTDGALRNGDTLLAQNDLPVNTTAPIAYVYDKMGYDLLTGDALEYARMATRWPLSTTASGIWWTYGRHYVNGSYLTEWYQQSGTLAYLQYGVLRASGE